jgi:hypothetical protein
MVSNVGGSGDDFTSNHFTNNDWFNVFSSRNEKKVELIFDTLRLGKPSYNLVRYYRSMFKEFFDHWLLQNMDILRDQCFNNSAMDIIFHWNENNTWEIIKKNTFTHCKARRKVFYCSSNW